MGDYIPSLAPDGQRASGGLEFIPLACKGQKSEGNRQLRQTASLMRMSGIHLSAHLIAE